MVATSGPGAAAGVLGTVGLTSWVAASAGKSAVTYMNIVVSNNRLMCPLSAQGRSDLVIALGPSMAGVGDSIERILNFPISGSQGGVGRAPAAVAASFSARTACEMEYACSLAPGVNLRPGPSPQIRSGSGF